MIYIYTSDNLDNDHLLYITGITIRTNHTEISPSDISKYLSTPYLFRERLGECEHTYFLDIG
jgi:hypothetical protein